MSYVKALLSFEIALPAKHAPVVPERNPFGPENNFTTLTSENISAGTDRSLDGFGNFQYSILLNTGRLLVVHRRALYRLMFSSLPAGWLVLWGRRL